MISTCLSDVAPTILVRSIRAGRCTPSRYNVSVSVPVAWPPVLRNAGARSTMVTSNPRRVSQYASTGPEMLAPDIRIRMTTSLKLGKPNTMTYLSVSQLSSWGEQAPVRHQTAHPGGRSGPVSAAGRAAHQSAGHRRQTGDHQTCVVLPLRLAGRPGAQHPGAVDRRR